MANLIEYSYMLLDQAEAIKVKLPEIISLLKRGVKVTIFTNKKINTDCTTVKRFEDADLFTIYVTDFCVSEKVEVADGNVIMGKLEIIVEHFSFYNIEQFKIEHAPVNENIIVKAGAGTGKTKVMVDRVLYLLIKEKVDPSEIVLITFTRDATHNMEKRLRKALFKQHNITGSKKILDLIERISEINIQTIHAFSKRILKEIGSLEGYGLDFQLRGFKTEKKKWIEEELNSFLQAEMQEANTNIESIMRPLRLYELIDVIYGFWGKFEQRGFSHDEIVNNFCFGTASEHNEKLNDLICTVIKRVEAKFSSEKQRLNAVVLSDLTRQIDVIIKNHGSKVFENLSVKISHIFVDEFQDSDDAQIRLVSAIQKAFSSKLFVVGDTKQAIYRFRGAIHTAFDDLKETLSLRGITINDTDYFLDKNYRSTVELLNEIDEYFSWWGNKGYLQYNDKFGKLVGVKSGVSPEVPLTIINKVEQRKEEMKEHVMPVVLERYRQIRELNLAIRNINPHKSDNEIELEKIAALTRTIKEARLLGKWCEEKEVPFKLSVGGDFFLSEPVRHFYSLLLYLLSPKNLKYKANVLEGPFNPCVKYSLPEVIDNLGAMNRIETILEGSGADYNYGDIRAKLAYHPVMAVIRLIFQEGDPYSWVYTKKLDQLKKKHGDIYSKDQIETEAWNYTREYELNMGKLLEKIHQSFSQEFVSLHQIIDWLHIQIATNREEEKITLENVKGGMDHLHIMTVHRSKGLEFTTVVIPFTERQFTNAFSEILLKDDKAGWIIRKPGQEERYNEYYSELSEEEEREGLSEEVRLLYVAMTRAKNQLVIIRNTKNDHFKRDNTWAKLLTKYR